MDELNKLRKEIDTTDKKLLLTLSKRAGIVKKIGKLKKSQGHRPLNKKRWLEVLKSRIEFAETLGLNPRYIKKIYTIIHNYSLEIESEATPSR